MWYRRQTIQDHISIVIALKDPLRIKIPNGIRECLSDLKRQELVAIIDIKNHYIVLPCGIRTTSDKEEMTDTACRTRQPSSSNGFTSFAIATAAANRDDNLCLFFTDRRPPHPSSNHWTSVAKLPANRLDFGAHGITDTRESIAFNNTYAQGRVDMPQSPKTITKTPCPKRVTTSHQMQWATLPLF
ncbi:MAG: hypothetical protein RL759_1582 [Verrucomicrobiota bacterium]